MPETRGLEVEYFLIVLGGWSGDPDDARNKGFGSAVFFDCVVCGWVGIRTMPEKRGLSVEFVLLVLGRWAGHPDDARATGSGV